MERDSKAISDKADVYYEQQKEKNCGDDKPGVDGRLSDSDVELPG